mmetsp:Transcript_70057/g.200767  ORF Transcript_70057/g.200767 Transcript_70057/m.200767 type:complete len:255 (-) Transcript_70057:1250-2014(-)
MHMPVRAQDARPSDHSPGTTNFKTRWVEARNAPSIPRARRPNIGASLFVATGAQRTRESLMRDTAFCKPQPCHSDTMQRRTPTSGMSPPINPMRAEVQASPPNPVRTAADFRHHASCARVFASPLFPASTSVSSSASASVSSESSPRGASGGASFKNSAPRPPNPWATAATMKTKGKAFSKDICDSMTAKIMVQICWPTVTQQFSKAICKAVLTTFPSCAARALRVATSPKGMANEPVSGMMENMRQSLAKPPA